MQLYGGAISVDLPPAVDVLKFRQVPDTQEVFIFEGETKDKDTSVIFELLETVPGDIDEAIKVHVDDILDHVDTVEPADPAGDARLFLVVSKGGSLLTIVGLIRLDRVSTDVLVTMNVPLSSDEQLVLGDGSPHALLSGHIKQHYSTVRQACASFKVENWGLFG